MLKESQQKLLVCCGKNPQARVALICFPFSGAGPAWFRRWSKAFAGDVEFFAVQLPGREARYSEPMTMPLDQLVDDMAACITQSIEKPYAFFGHSLGAYLAWCTALRIQQIARNHAGARTLATPAALFLSARQAPDVVVREPLATLSDEALLKRLCIMGGIPAELQSERELLQYALPKIRYDLLLNETAVPHYLLSDIEGVHAPLYVYEGIHDQHTQDHDLSQWQNFTRARFQLRRLSGDHFFINESKQEFVQQFKNDMRDAFSST